MASRQMKPENKVTGGGSLYDNLQVQIMDSQYQNQIQKELKEFIIKIMDQKFDEFKQEFKQEVKEMIRDVEGAFQEKSKKWQKDLIMVTDSLSEAILQIEKTAVENNLETQSKIKLMDHKMYNVQNKLQELENQVTMIQMRLMESALRLRGIKESNSQDLRRVCADSLAGMLQIKSEEIFGKIEQIYRVNSYVAKEKQLPRDVVIHFADKKMRDDILQKSFVSALQAGGKKIEVYKELPSKMLKDRKSFGFLVTELKKKHIPFRWNAPAGIIFWFQGKRYQLNTVEKAEEFYNNVFIPVSKSSTIIVDQDNKQDLKQDLKVYSNQMKKEPMERQQEAEAELPSYLRELFLKIDSKFGVIQDQSVTQSDYEEQQRQGPKPQHTKNKQWKRSHKFEKF